MEDVCYQSLEMSCRILSVASHTMTILQDVERSTSFPRSASSSAHSAKVLSLIRAAVFADRLGNSGGSLMSLVYSSSYLQVSCPPGHTHSKGYVIS